MSDIDKLMKDLVDWNNKDTQKVEYYIDIVIVSNQKDGAASIYFGSSNYIKPYFGNPKEWLFASKGSIFYPTQYALGHAYPADFNWVNYQNKPPEGVIKIYSDDRKIITESVHTKNFVLSNEVLSASGARNNGIIASYLISFNKNQHTIVL